MDFIKTFSREKTFDLKSRGLPGGMLIYGLNVLKNDFGNKGLGDTTDKFASSAPFVYAESIVVYI